MRKPPPVADGTGPDAQSTDVSTPSQPPPDKATLTDTNPSPINEDTTMTEASEDAPAMTAPTAAAAAPTHRLSDTTITPVTISTAAPNDPMTGEVQQHRKDFLRKQRITSWADLEDEDDDEEDDAGKNPTTEGHPAEPLKNYSMKVIFGLKKQQQGSDQIHLSLFRELASTMMAADDSLKISAYDRTTASDLWPLASAKDLPKDDAVAEKYFVNPKYNRRHTSVSGIFRVTSTFSHVQWRKEIADYLSQHRVKIQQYRLEALETTCIGFLAKKHPHHTHLHRFEQYLRATLPGHTPEFMIRYMAPRIPAGFSEAIQTEVLGIETSTEHASILDTIFQEAFPPSNDETEFFVSYKAGMDDSTLRAIYHIQNKWLQQVRVVRINNRNIDKKFNLGLSEPVSLREFIRNQPANSDNSRYAMDVDNGGTDGRTVIIVMPQYLKAAQATYETFRTLSEEVLPGGTTTPAGHEFVLQGSTEDNSYAAKMAAIVNVTLRDSDSDDSGTPTNDSYFSGSSHSARSSSSRSKKSSQRGIATARTRDRSYAEVTKSRTRSSASQSFSTNQPASIGNSDPDTVADMESTVSTMTSAQQSDILLEMHAMLKAQKVEIKKLKKRYEHSQRTTTSLKDRMDFICDSLDALSQRTPDSGLSSALSMISSKARSDDSDSLDSKDGAEMEPPPQRQVKILFSNAVSRTFDVSDPPAHIRPAKDDARPTTAAERPTTTVDPVQGWLSPTRKKQKSSLRSKVTPSPNIATANPFSPLQEEPYTDDSGVTKLSSLGRTRSPTNKPNNNKKVRISPPVPDLDTQDGNRALSDSGPLYEPAPDSNDTNPDMIWEISSGSHYVDGDSDMQESADESL
jgi:hypothetical protein